MPPGQSGPDDQGRAARGRAARTSSIVADIERVLCASPGYLRRAGAVTTIADLKRRDGLLTIGGNRWTFHDGARNVSVTAPGRLATNQVEVLHASVLQGCGIAMLPGFLVLDDLAAGRLVRLLPGTPPTPGAAHAARLAQRVEAVWRETSDRPLRLFAGWEDFGYAVAFYLPGRPQVVNALDGLPPWLV